MGDRSLLSICIPAYEMHGLGARFLDESLAMISKQTFRDFDVVISDESKTNAIKDVCDAYAEKIDIRYHRKADGKNGMASNTNHAIRKATGRLIKVLLLDDFLYTKTALEEIVSAFDLEKDHWLVTACIHTRNSVDFFRPFYPRYDDRTILFKNTISSPSVLTIKNDRPELFDENILWYVDLDYYKRSFDRFGVPKIVNKIGVVNRLGEHQATNTAATDELREAEFRYVIKKHSLPHPRLLILKYKMDAYRKKIRSYARKVLKRSS